MAAVTIRNLPDATHRALKRRAKLHGRSTEAEIRDILEKATSAVKKMGVGDELAEIGRQLGGVDLSFERSKEEDEPPIFE